MIIASIHHQYNTVSLLSIPRDLYVVTKDGYGTKINALYRAHRKLGDAQAKKVLITEVEEIINEPIHYNVMVDFNGFAAFVDALGGVEINVENSFVDHYYPTADKGWESIQFEKGLQIMDGTKALKYARSRHAEGFE
ncbi:MAG: LCP family protein [Patescibacteria group bacterium]|nr:LCP family protein [Patescibacteria group bacterium]